jgi:hypothetical protein
MKFFFVVMGSITAIGWIVALLDWYARKKDRDSKGPATG